MSRVALILGYALAVLPLLSRAGGGPFHTLVVVNDNSAESLEIGQYYQDLRELPERNIVHVQAATNYTVDLSDFTNQVVGPILAYLGTADLSNQIDVIVLTRGLPYRVRSGSTDNGATAVLFYGFKADGPPCSLTNAAQSDYYQQERAFTHSGAPSSNRYYLSSILTGLNFDESLRALDRAAASDHSAPTGRVVLLHTADYPRSIRWEQFDDAIFQAQFLPPLRVWESPTSDGLNASSNLAGYCTGVVTEPNLSTLGFTPGALAEHLTSYGGCLLDPLGQMSILQWLAAGAAGSYGTVVEPCNYPQKFPAARLHFWYERGFSLAESFAMALHSPYMGVTVGDPLTAPYAVLPLVSVSGLVAGAVVTSDVAVVFHASTTGLAGRVSKLDAFVDGRFVATVTNIPPTPGNTVTVTIASSTRSHTVKTGDSLADVALGLAAQLNAGPPISCTATAYGDRIQLTQKTLGASGAWIHVSASFGQGTAGVCTISARSVFSNLLESSAAARESLLLAGNPVSGDVVRAAITRLDGAVVTNEVVAGASSTSYSLLQALTANINADPLLAGSSGCRADWLRVIDTTNVEVWLIARTNGWQGHNAQVKYSVITNLGSTLNSSYSLTDNFNDNGSALAARAAIFLTEGATNLQSAWTLAVTNLPDGPHELEVVAYEGSVVRSQGRARLPFTVKQHDMTCALTNPPAGRYVFRGSLPTVEVAVVSPSSVTQVEFFAEGKRVSSTSAPPYDFVWATTNYGAGIVGLQAVARDTRGLAACSEIIPISLYSDEDGDGLPDQWEYRMLGSRTNSTANADPDGDGQDNLAEFLADTDPQNFLSRHEIRALDAAAGVQLLFPATNTRSFIVEVADDLGLANLWSSATNSVFTTNGLAIWPDAATNGIRFYRVRASLP